MRPQTIGRALGIGVRVAGRIAGKHLAGAAQAAASPQPASAANAAVRVVGAAQTARRATVQTSGGVLRGVGGFLRPFQRVGRKIWLEVTGVFFLLPALVFAPNLWRMRASWAQGPDHRTFLVTALVVVVFLYLGVSSFWRAGRR